MIPVQRSSVSPRFCESVIPQTLTAKWAIALSEGDRKATPLEYRFPSHLERDRTLRVP
jgi:hypothetical protein